MNEPQEGRVGTFSISDCLFVTAAIGVCLIAADRFGVLGLFFAAGGSVGATIGWRRAGWSSAAIGLLGGFILAWCLAGCGAVVGIILGVIAAILGIGASGGLD